jgi:ankyrin repeat protein
MGLLGKLFRGAPSSGGEPSKDDKIKFLTAARKGELETIKKLISRYPAIISIKTEESMSALHYAAGLGHYSVVETLLGADADVNARNNSGWTPLHFAADQGKKDLVLLLLEKGAKPNAGANDGATPLWLARNAGHKETEKILKSRGAGYEGQDELLLKEAVEALKRKDTEKGVRALKEAIRINPNLAKAHQLLALHYMGVQNGELAKEHFEILKTLDQKLTKELLDTPLGPMFERGVTFIKT